MLQQNATVEVDSVAFLPGGQLSGGGVFPFDLVNRGVVALGDSVGHTDTLTVQEGYIQTSEGTMEVELGDPSDLLLVSGDAHFDSTLRIGLVEGFTPQVGDTFLVAQYGGPASGVFSQIVFSQGLEGTVSYGNRLVQIMVSSVTGIMDKPEPLPGVSCAASELPQPLQSGDASGFRAYPKRFYGTHDLRRARPEDEDAGAPTAPAGSLHRAVGRHRREGSLSGKWSVCLSASDGEHSADPAYDLAAVNPNKKAAMKALWDVSKQPGRFIQTQQGMEQHVSAVSDILGM